MRIAILFIVLFCYAALNASAQSFGSVRAAFIGGYSSVGIPEFTLDYQYYFAAIPQAEDVHRQEVFFKDMAARLARVAAAHLSRRERVQLQVMLYEVAFNLKRIDLELQWIKDSRKIPVGGLHGLKDYKDWYTLFVQKFTTSDMLPEEVFAMGKAEVVRAQSELKRIRLQLGYEDEAAFHKHLLGDSFFIKNKNEVLLRFKQIDSTVRCQLQSFVDVSPIPPVYAMEWPDADANTPPGMYLNHTQNAYGKDIFQFNFYGRRYNYRAMEWLYMHEAIPGHHLQSTLRRPDSLLDLFLYPGNFEGWGCYVEYYGKELGLYRNLYTELGKWEWDLVRSVRLVLDAGIHYYGWSRAEALKYWHEHIAGQDDIAEREVRRVTNWAAQALSYKVGAHRIFHMQKKWLKTHPGGDLKAFRKAYLSFGMAPIAVIELNI